MFWMFKTSKHRPDPRPAKSEKGKLLIKSNIFYSSSSQSLSTVSTGSSALPINAHMICLRIKFSSQRQGTATSHIWREKGNMETDGQKDSELYKQRCIRGRWNIEALTVKYETSIEELKASNSKYLHQETSVWSKQAWS